MSQKTDAKRLLDEMLPYTHFEVNMPAYRALHDVVVTPGYGLLSKAYRDAKEQFCKFNEILAVAVTTETELMAQALKVAPDKVEELVSAYATSIIWVDLYSAGNDTYESLSENLKELCDAYDIGPGVPLSINTVGHTEFHAGYTKVVDWYAYYMEHRKVVEDAAEDDDLFLVGMEAYAARAVMIYVLYRSLFGDAGSPTYDELLKFIESTMNSDISLDVLSNLDPDLYTMAKSLTEMSVEDEDTED